MRTCIKCNKQLPVSMFNDNWRHKTNICKDCHNKYQREYPNNMTNKDHTKDYIKAIHNFIKENHYSPSIAEFAKYIGKAESTSGKIMDNLVMMGYAQKKFRSPRSIKLTERGMKYAGI